jgi:SAM-dependent methyltransferase
VINSKGENPYQRALWQIYRRLYPAQPWRDGDNLPWDDPAFSERMLREHLDQSHGAASRQRPEILRLVDWLWGRLGLQPGSRVLDITCGPGLYGTELARRGVYVTGIDFSPASIRHARELAEASGVAGHCQFLQADVREAMAGQVGQGYDAALFLYGQLAVFRREEAAQLLGEAAGALRPGGRLAVELLDFERIDKGSSSWWFTDDAGLWGDEPFLCLGERRWDPELRASIDRFFVVDLGTGHLQQVGLSDNGYEIDEMLALLHNVGFGQAWAYPAWGGLRLYDAEEWVAYVAER